MESLEFIQTIFPAVPLLHFIIIMQASSHSKHDMSLKILHPTLEIISFIYSDTRCSVCIFADLHGLTSLL